MPFRNHRDAALPLEVAASPPSDPDGSGSAVLEIKVQGEFICYEIHTANLTTPTTGATITFGASGPAAFDLIVIDSGADLTEWLSVSRHSTPTRRDLNRITKDPGSY